MLQTDARIIAKNDDSFVVTIKISNETIAMTLPRSSHPASYQSRQVMTCPDVPLDRTPVTLPLGRAKLAT
jgi:hypothetical protein